jgi:hypothetical protein
MESNKTKTALDFFVEELFKKIDYMQVPQKLIDQAKEMEKQQIKEAFYDGKNLYNNWEDGSNQYYNETYGDK